MKCQIGEAIKKIDKLISSSSKVDNNIKKQLAEAKNNLQSAIEIRMARMQSNSPGSESKKKINERIEKGISEIKNQYINDKMFVLPENITELKDNQVFVFGANAEGIHGKGSALQARKFGTLNGEAINTFSKDGNTWGIVTKESPNGSKVSFGTLSKNIKKLINYANDDKYSDKEFLFTAVGTGLAGFRQEDILEILQNVEYYDNIKFPAKWKKAYYQAMLDDINITDEGDVYDTEATLDDNTSNISNKKIIGSESKRPEFDKLPSYKEGQKNMVYAGIGSRETPLEIQQSMNDVAKELESIGYTLRSGNAIGADKAFEGAPQPWSKDSKGSVKQWSKYSHKVKNKEIFKAENATDKTRKIAKEIHANPTALSGIGLDLMARNTNQIFGSKLDTPVDFVLAWTPLNEQGKPVTKHEDKSYDKDKKAKKARGEETFDTGGTGQAISYASLKGIPVINMSDKNWREQLDNVLNKKDQEKIKVETKPSEPEIKYGSVVKYKPENGTEGYYIVRGFSSNGGLQLTDSEGKNFSGTPNVDKVKFVKQLETKIYNYVNYIIDSNNRVYTKHGKVADSYVNQIIGKNKTETKENDTNAKENKDIINLDKKISEIFNNKLYGDIVSDFEKGNKDSAVEKIIKTYSSIETDTDENIDLKMKVNDRVRIVKGLSSALNDYSKLSRKMIEDLFGKNVERNYEIQPGITASKGQKNLIDTGIKFLEDKKNADNIGENIMIVQGRGGTGKTSSISRVLINYINENNFTRKPSIFMMTLSHQAKDVLNGMSKQISKETGIIPTTEVIAGAMAWYANGDPRTPGSKIEQRTVSFNDKKISYENKDAKREGKISSSVSSSSSGDIIVVDEASMLDSHELGYLLEKTKQGVKVILMGDYHQAKIVSPNSNNLIGFGEKSEYSKVFDHFTGSKDPLLTNATISELTEIHRQKEGSNILDFADYYADVIDSRIGNKKEKPIKPKANEKDVSYINKDDVVSGIVKDINNGKDAIYIAHTNRDVTVTNNEIRNVVSKDSENEYSVGDRMIAYANYSMQGEPPIITNSERLIVSKIENATNEEVLNEKAKQINGSRTYEFKYRTQDSSGKKIQYKKLTLQRKSYSDDSFNVTVIVPDGLLRKVIKAFENKATGSFDTIYKDLLSSYIYADGYQYGPNKDTINFFSAGSILSYGYAITAHKSQGSTVDVVYTTLPSDPNLAYVAITRAREKVNIVGKEDSQSYNPQSNIIYNPEFHKTKYPDGKDYVQISENKSYDMHIELALLNSPSILKIGTKEQYINYLKTIFPDSEHQELFSHRGSFSPQDNNSYNKLNSEKINLLKDYLDSIGFKYEQNRDDLIRYSVENINILTDKDIGLSYKDKVYGVITAYPDEDSIAPEISETINFDSENDLYEISVTKELYGKLKEIDYKYSFINKEGFDKKFIGTGDKRSAIGDNSFSGFSFTNYVNNDTGSQAYMMPGYAGLQKESDILVAKLNTKNIKLTDSGITNVDDKTDTLIIGHITNEIIVKYNNQIHILGSVEDIKKFKKFVKYNNNNPQSEPGVVDNNKYETISKDDIEAAKDIMSNNKKECE